MITDILKFKKFNSGNSSVFTGVLSMREPLSKILYKLNSGSKKVVGRKLFLLCSLSLQVPRDNWSREMGEIQPW